MDLNLLVVLQALLEDGDITGVSPRLGIPQASVKDAVAQLRDHYGDELLLQTGAGYELTPLARTLLPSVQESIRLAQNVFYGEQAYLSLPRPRYSGELHGLP